MEFPTIDELAQIINPVAFGQNQTSNIIQQQLGDACMICRKRPFKLTHLQAIMTWQIVFPLNSTKCSHRWRALLRMLR